MSKSISIIGAGPGGLTAGLILANKGYDVNIFETKDCVGGRTSSFKLGDFTFDLGPTFFMMDYILKEVFESVGKKLENYVELISIDPMYRLVFKDKTIHPTRDESAMLNELRHNFPGNEDGYIKYMQKEKEKFDKLVPCLQIPYGKLSDFGKRQFIKSLPFLDAHVTLHDVLGRYFNDEDLKIAFTFQSKYLGMSPWKAPGTFSILSYIEHGGGITHAKGGLNQLTKALAKAYEEEGGTINLNSNVKRLIVEKGKCIGVILENGEEVFSDYTIINSDFAYSMNNLVHKNDKKKYSKEKVDKKKYSCSTFMMYLGIDRVYDIPHHNIVFADDYRKNVDEITDMKIVSEDMSIYVQNACTTDTTLAPEGKSTLYVLVPVPNEKSNIDWSVEKDNYRERVLKIMEDKLDMKDLIANILEERIITPTEWVIDYNINYGAVFNLAHTVDQMLYFRPHNEFEEFENCYLVGGGTHPGSGLPTIIESGRISSNIIIDRDKKK